MRPLSTIFWRMRLFSYNYPAFHFYTVTKHIGLLVRQRKIIVKEGGVWKR